MQHHSCMFAAKRLRPTGLGDEEAAVVVQREPAMQDEVELFTPAEDQPLLFERLCVVAVIVLLDTQVIVQLQHCVHGRRDECHLFATTV